MKALLKLIRRALIVLVALAVVAAGALVWRGHALYRAALERESVEDAVALLKEQPGYITIDELPQVYLDAVVAVEDHRFYGHAGIDLIAICRAAVNDLRTMSLAQGGSTITQQVAKNLFFTQEKRFDRKVAEVFVALDLERAYSKREILELYVNSSYFGAGHEGIGQAAPGYLGKPPQEMSDYESTLMAGIPNAPSLLSADPAAAEARQRIVVRQMLKYGFDPGDATPGVPYAALSDGG